MPLRMRVPRDLLRIPRSWRVTRTARYHDAIHPIRDFLVNSPLYTTQIKKSTHAFFYTYPLIRKKLTRVGWEKGVA
jgi:hypothetical protein